VFVCSCILYFQSRKPVDIIDSSFWHPFFGLASMTCSCVYTLKVKD